jgi:hypothetical protein
MQPEGPQTTPSPAYPPQQISLTRALLPCPPQPHPRSARLRIGKAPLDTASPWGALIPRKLRRARVSTHPTSAPGSRSGTRGLPARRPRSRFRACNLPSAREIPRHSPPASTSRSDPGRVTAPCRLLALAGAGSQVRLRVGMPSPMTPLSRRAHTALSSGSAPRSRGRHASTEGVMVSGESSASRVRTCTGRVGPHSEGGAPYSARPVPMTSRAYNSPVAPASAKGVLFAG